MSIAAVSSSPLATRLPSLFDTEPGKAVTLADLTSFAEKKLDTFNKQFEALLEANGIDTSTPITLDHVFGSGRVVVTNDHPQAGQIDELLGQDFELCNTYTAATSALEIAKQGEEHARFAKAYAQDPQMAVAQFSHFLNTHWDVQVAFSQDGYKVGYSN
jgi:hypothetical protein